MCKETAVAYFNALNSIVLSETRNTTTKKHNPHAYRDANLEPKSRLINYFNLFIHRLFCNFSFVSKILSENKLPLWLSP
jgi:hypothetical protein